MKSILEWWQHFAEHTEYWNAFWPAVLGALVGAVTAFSLERHYRKRERIAREIGECNKLIFILGQMLTALLIINDSLFEEPRKKLGRAPTWNEIGALDGAPTEGPDFIIGEYTFLLEGDDPKSLAPFVLGKIYAAESEFKAILARVSERSRLWHEYNEIRSANKFARGESAMAGIAAPDALTARIKELTGWISTPLPEAIERIKKIIPELRTTLTNRYPKGHFMFLWPNDDPSALPL